MATGASESRTFRGITVSNTWSLKVRRISSATWFARLFGENMVRTIPSTLRPGFARGAHELDRLQHVGEPLERVVLALERDHDALGRDEAVQREQARATAGSR